MPWQMHYSSQLAFVSFLPRMRGMPCLAGWLYGAWALHAAANSACECFGKCGHVLPRPVSRICD